MHAERGPMHAAHARRSGVLLASALAVVTLAACGGDSGEQGAVPAAPALTVPGYSGTPEIRKPKAAPGADTTAAASARAEQQEAEQGGEPAAADDPTAEAAAPAPPAETTTTAPSSGAEAASPGEFQAFCANNPGAC